MMLITSLIANRHIQRKNRTRKKTCLQTFQLREEERERKTNKAINGMTKRTFVFKKSTRMLNVIERGGREERDENRDQFTHRRDRRLARRQRIVQRSCSSTSVPISETCPAFSLDVPEVLELSKTARRAMLMHRARGMKD